MVEHAGYRYGDTAAVAHSVKLYWAVEDAPDGFLYARKKISICIRVVILTIRALESMKLRTIALANDLEYAALT